MAAKEEAAAAASSQPPRSGSGRQSDAPPSNLAGRKVGPYVLEARVGMGQFAYVWRARNAAAPAASEKAAAGCVALKVASTGGIGGSSLQREAEVLREIAPAKPPRIVALLDSGKCENLAYLALPLLGENLFTVRNNAPQGRLPLDAVFTYGVQMLQALEALHRCGYIHRDIKPANFCLGTAGKRELQLIDFGLARRWRNAETGRANERRTDASFRGSTTYASASVMRDVDQCRADDLWGVLYITVECLAGGLPWRYPDPNASESVVRVTKKEDIINLKEECIADPTKLMPVTRAGAGEKLPVPLVKFSDLLKPLGFDDAPRCGPIIDLLEVAAKSAANAAAAKLAAAAATSGPPRQAPMPPPAHPQANDGLPAAYASMTATPSSSHQSFRKSQSAAVANYAATPGNFVATPGAPTPGARAPPDAMAHPLADLITSAAGELSQTVVLRGVVQMLEIAALKAKNAPREHKRKLAEMFNDVSEYAQEAKKRCME